MSDLNKTKLSSSYVTPENSKGFYNKEKIILLPLYCYKISGLLFIKVRLAEESAYAKTHENSSAWRNIKNMVRRYLHSSMPGREIRLRFQDQTQYVITNEEGMAETMFRIPEGTGKNIGITASFTEVTEVHLQIRPYDLDQGNFTVISDIDDTVIVSHSPEFVKKFKLLLFKNAFTRTPLTGVGPLYKKLHNSPPGEDVNPIIYVSSSEWNLLDLLQNFMTHNDIPQGPMFLRTYHNSLWELLRAKSVNHLHKLNKINHVLSLKQERKHILIGDSGQRDPEVYLRAYSHFSRQIAAMFIRSTERPEREKEVMQMAKKVNAPLYLIYDSEEILKVLQERNLV